MFQSVVGKLSTDRVAGKVMFSQARVIVYTGGEGGIRACTWAGGVCRGWVSAWGGGCLTDTPRATDAVGTHHTGMHPCFSIFFSTVIHLKTGE